jgi:hypothetical protein
MSLRNSGWRALVVGLSQCVHDWQCDLAQVTAMEFMREGLRVVENGKQIPLRSGTPQGSDNRGRTVFMRNGSYIRFSLAVVACFVIFIAAR